MLHCYLRPPIPLIYFGFDHEARAPQTYHAISYQTLAKSDNPGNVSIFSIVVVRYLEFDRNWILTI